MNTELDKAIKLLGAYKIARICGVRGPSVYKWIANGRLPRTEWTGETNYSQKIADASNGAISRSALLVINVVADPQCSSPSK
jgi:hypothetical protein